MSKSQFHDVRTSDANGDRVRAMLRENPRAMTLELAERLGVPEVEVIRALPRERVTELDVTRWEPMLRRLEGVGRVRVLVSSAATTMESMGCFGGFSTWGDYFNVQTPTLDLHIRWRRLVAVFAVEKPGHLDGAPTYSLQFYDDHGQSALKVFLSFGETMSLERQELFQDLRQEFRKP